MRSKTQSTRAALKIPKPFFIAHKVAKLLLGLAMVLDCGGLWEFHGAVNSCPLKDVQVPFPFKQILTTTHV